MLIFVNVFFQFIQEVLFMVFIEQTDSKYNSWSPGSAVKSPGETLLSLLQAPSGNLRLEQVLVFL